MKRLFLFLLFSCITITFVQAQSNTYRLRDVRAKTISSIAAQTTITAEQTTLFADLAHQLPKTVACTLSSGPVTNLPVVWAIGSYNKDVAATYTLSGTITLPSNITNPSAFTASINVTVQWSPLADQSKNILWLNPSNKYTLLKESNSNVPITAVDNANHPVGWMMDRSLGARDVLATSDTRRPFYYVDSDGFPLLEYRGIQQLVVQNSKKYLNTLNKAAPSFSIVAYVKRKVDASAGQIFSSNAGSGSNPGTYLALDASNHFVFELTKNGGGNMAFFTTSQTLTVSNGRQPIFIEINGTGASAGRISVGGSTFSTFSVVAGVDALDAFANFTVGARDDAQNFSQDYISDIIIRSGTLSAGDITNYQNWLPQDKGFWFAPVLQNWYDYTDATNNFSNAGGTVQVTNNDEILYSKNKATLPTGTGSSNTDATAGAGAAPQYRTSQLNSLAAAHFDGSNDKLTLQTATNKGGIYTAIVVYRNDDATNGSVMLDGIEAVAELQATDIEFGAALRTQTGAGATIGETIQPNRNNAANVVVFERYANTENIYNGYKDIKTVTGDATPFVFSTMGTGLSAGYWMDGIVSEVLIYKGKLANVSSTIDTYNTKYAITPTAGTTPSVWDIIVYFIFGQSNVMSGTAPWLSTGHNAYSTMPSYLQATQSSVNQYTGAGYSANFTHNSSATWGWTDEFLYRESIRLNRTFFVFNFGRPSTTLGTLNPFPQATALAYLQDAYSRLCVTYGSARIKPVIIWDQGVSDAATSSDANNYQANEAAWFTSLRQITGKNTIILNYQLGSWSTQTYTSTVRAAKVTNTTWQNILINTDDINHTADNQHYDETTGGCILLGQRASTTLTSYIK